MFVGIRQSILFRKLKVCCFNLFGCGKSFPDIFVDFKSVVFNNITVFIHYFILRKCVDGNVVAYACNRSCRGFLRTHRCHCGELCVLRNKRCFKYNVISVSEAVRGTYAEVTCIGNSRNLYIIYNVVFAVPFAILGACLRNLIEIAVRNIFFEILLRDISAGYFILRNKCEFYGFGQYSADFNRCQSVFSLTRHSFRRSNFHFGSFRVNSPDNRLDIGLVARFVRYGYQSILAGVLQSGDVKRAVCKFTDFDCIVIAYRGNACSEIVAHIYFARYAVGCVNIVYNERCVRCAAVVIKHNFIIFNRGQVYLCLVCVFVTYCSLHKYCVFSVSKRNFRCVNG